MPKKLTMPEMTETEERLVAKLRDFIDQAQDCCDKLLKIAVIIKVSKEWSKDQHYIATEQIAEILEE